MYIKRRIYLKFRTIFFVIIGFRAWLELSNRSGVTKLLAGNQPVKEICFVYMC